MSTNNTCSGCFKAFNAACLDRRADVPDNKIAYPCRHIYCVECNQSRVDTHTYSCTVCRVNHEKYLTTQYISRA